MACFRAEIDLALGRVLRARHLFAVDSLDPAPILKALLHHLGMIAQALDCATIRLAAREARQRVFLPAKDILPLQLHLRPESWRDISFSADRLGQNQAKAWL
jgi:hypothetical protein